MTEKSLSDIFTEAMLLSLEETFENVKGIYLDRDTSLFETLATVSAEEASRPVSANCASIAAHVAHMVFYIETLLDFMRGERREIDWSEIWKTVEAVTEDEWAASQVQLREAYQGLRKLAESTSWEMDRAVGGAMGILMHNAYHLGEIRQALCTIRGSASS